MTMDLRGVLATVAWTSVLALALARSLAGVEGATVWALLAAQVATVVTGWLIVEWVVRRSVAEALQELREMDDRTVERVARRLAVAVRDEDNVSSLR